MSIRVAELFAGVGGFRVGLEAASPLFETVWWNQWEPATKTVQHAHDIYYERFCRSRGLRAARQSNDDVSKVAIQSVRKHDLLVAGFPCQDYSVATSLDKAGGLQGKKGVLWWEIVRILEKRRPAYVLLENVDRLLKSPAKQRGRDFAIVLGCLRDLGYRAEWRVINAADYSCATRRRRVFIFAARARTGIGRFMASAGPKRNYLTSTGFFPSEFDVSFQHDDNGDCDPSGTLPDDVRKVSADYKHEFENAGVMIGGRFWHLQVTADNEGAVTLEDKLDPEVPGSDFHFDMTHREAWERAKGAKTIKRRAESGFEYLFAEGKMTFPDSVRRPARTVLTSEANRLPNRTTHVIEDPRSKRWRFLTPTEVERIMGFEPGWTDLPGVPMRWRYFTMGNSLVVDIVRRIGTQLERWVRTHETHPAAARLLEQGQKRRPVLVEAKHG